MKNRNHEFNETHLRNIKKAFEEKSGVRLEAHPEREISMGRKAFKLAAIVAVVVLLSITGVVAAMKLGADFGVFSEFFRGDVSPIQDEVRFPHEQASDSNFTLTLEEVLTDNRYIFMVYSVEALTDDALTELMGADDLIHDYEFKNNITVSPSPGVITQTGTAYTRYSRELVERHTDTTRYWAYCDEMEDVSAEPMTVRLEVLGSDISINVPTETTIESKEMTLTGQPHGDVFVRLSPMGITVEKNVDSDFDTRFSDVFFRMSSGEIKTLNQLDARTVGFYVMYAGALQDSDLEHPRYLYGSRFYDVIPLSEFKSIIVGGIEYDINDPAKTKEVTLDAKLYPFEVKALLLEARSGYLAVEEVCDGLGAEMTWDGAVLTISYRGSVTEVTVGNNVYVKDGKSVEYPSSDDGHILIYEDTMFMGWPVLAEILGVGASEDSDSVERIYEPVKYTPGYEVGTQIVSLVTPQYVRYFVIP